MRLCHAAVLALVGWYLMMPDGPGASLPNGLTLVSTYKTRRECKKAAAALRAEGYGSSAVDRNSESAGERVWQQENATCVAVGTPRPKSK